MRTALIGVLSLVILISCNNSKQENKTETKSVSIHSNSFNASVQSALDSYHALTEAFVNWDSATVDKKAAELRLKLDSINFYGFTPASITAPVDTLNLAKNDLQAMTTAKDIFSKRQALNTLSQRIYSFLNTVQYDEKKIYLQECPMAFNNEATPGMWLSRNEAIRNPYMGLHHPKYGKAMIECGDTKDSVNFTGATAL